MNKTKDLTEVMKKGWVSNFTACIETRSAHGDRILRRIRQNPPKGWEMVERKITWNNPQYKVYKLEKVKEDDRN